MKIRFHRPAAPFRGPAVAEALMAVAALGAVPFTSGVGLVLLTVLASVNAVGVLSAFTLPETEEAYAARFVTELDGFLSTKVKLPAPTPAEQTAVQTVADAVTETPPAAQ